jgi:hypothetical protein
MRVLNTPLSAASGSGHKTVSTKREFTMSVSITASSSHSFNHSIALALSAGDKKPVGAGELTPQKRINEQEAYAALLHHELKKSKPKLAARFERELGQATKDFMASHGGKKDMFKVSDRLMRQYVRERAVSQEDYRELKLRNMGKAQLDSDRTRISANKTEGAKDDDTPVRALSTFHKKLEVNPGLSEQEFAMFRSHEAAISAAKLRERRGISTRGVDNAAPSSEVNSTTATNGTRTVGTKDIPAGFLWKPISDSNGKLVVLLPSGLTSSVHAVGIASPNGGSVIEKGQFGGIGNGARTHFRFSKPGGQYPDGTEVQVIFTDGSQIRIPIAETSQRVESRR